MEHIVYYFSGTGNSLAVARELEKAGAEVRSMAHEYQKMQAEGKGSIVCEAKKIGFVVPTYYLGLPKLAHDFLRAFIPKSAGYIYVVATMGWSIRGGIIGQMKGDLKEKGGRLDMGLYVQMPMNDFTLVKVDEPERQKQLLQKAESRIQKAVQLVRDEKRHFDMEPISFMTQKRNAPFCETAKDGDRKFSVAEDCTGCGICARMCSVGNIKIVDGKPQWQHECQLCLACFHNCPKQAILYDGRGKEIPHYHHPGFSLGVKERYSK